jgi:hypothetical protein
MPPNTYSLRSKSKPKPKSPSNSEWSEVENSPKKHISNSDEEQAEKIRQAFKIMNLDPGNVERVRSTNRAMHKTIPSPEYPPGYKMKESVKKFLRMTEKQNNTVVVASTRKIIDQVGTSTASMMFVKNPDLFDLNNPKHQNIVGTAVETLRITEKETIDEYLDHLAKQGIKDHNSDKYYLNLIGMTPYTRAGTSKKYYRIRPGWTTSKH